MPDPGENIHTWSPVAADNAGADPLINWAEGMPRADVNNSARSEMAAHAKDRNIRNGSIITTGTINAQRFISGLGYTTGTPPVGMRVLLKIGAGLTNTGAATLEMDSLGAVAIKDMLLNDITGNSLVAGGYCEFLFNGTNWIIISAPAFRAWTVAVLTATNAAWPVPVGTKGMEIEVWGGGASGAGRLISQPGAGGGGGAGAYAFKYYAGTMDATLAVTVGAGGDAVNDNAAGIAGATSSVVGTNLGTIQCTGGTVTGNSGLDSGGAGGNATGGDKNISGGEGTSSQAVSNNQGGQGGDAPRGGGGGRSNVGAIGHVPGGGGAGQNWTGSGQSGAGARGQVVIKTR